MKKLIPASNAIFRLRVQIVLMPYVSENVSEYTKWRVQICIGLIRIVSVFESATENTEIRFHQL